MITKWQLFDHSGNRVDPERNPKRILTMTGHMVCYGSIERQPWVTIVGLTNHWVIIDGAGQLSQSHCDPKLYPKYHQPKLDLYRVRR